MALGERLADDIGAYEDRNTTGKWIAHHLAEKLEAAKKDPSVEAECVDLILKLWASRRDYPQGDPLARYDHLLPSLEKLLRAEKRYIPGFQDNLAPDDTAAKWLSLAENLDKLSSFLIAQFLKTAVREMDDIDDELLELAKTIENDPQTELITFLRVLAFEEEPEPTEVKDPLAERIENLRTLLDRVESLNKIEMG